MGRYLGWFYWIHHHARMGTFVDTTTRSKPRLRGSSWARSKTSSADPTSSCLIYEAQRSMSHRARVTCYFLQLCLFLCGALGLHIIRLFFWTSAVLFSAPFCFSNLQHDMWVGSLQNGCLLRLKLRSISYGWVGGAIDFFSVSIYGGIMRNVISK